MAGPDGSASTLQRWFQLIAQQGGWWPRELGASNLEVAAALLHAAAPDAGAPDSGAGLLAVAVDTGSIQLAQLVLRAFPRAAQWQGQASRSPLELALPRLRLDQLPQEPQVSAAPSYCR